MTKNIYSAFTKKLFGVKYERVGRTLLICLTVFWGLHISELQIKIAPFILYLMTSTFTASVMWALAPAQRAPCPSSPGRPPHPPGGPHPLPRV